MQSTAIFPYAERRSLPPYGRGWQEVALRIEMNCAVCGQNRFTILEGLDDDAADVNCSECGHHIGTMGELKERVAAEVLSRSSNQLRTQH